MSELFGGLLKPGEAGVLALRRELERRRETWTKGAPYVYRGGADLCLRFGQSFHGRVTPERYRHLTGTNGRCYVNALEACEQDPTLRYFEGYYTWGRGHFTSHGFCVDDEGVVELSVETWALDNFLSSTGAPIMPVETWTYWGVEFSPRLVRWHLDDPAGPKELPMMDRAPTDSTDPVSLMRGYDMTQSHDFPVLQHPYKPGRERL